MNEIQELTANDVVKPRFYRINVDTDRSKFNELIHTGQRINVFDQMESQLRELIKCSNPSLQIKPPEYKELIIAHLKGVDIYNYGVWVYYPWNNNLVHILDEQEFVKLRTNRNCNKITSAEQETLRKKKIGIIGLSVGQSIALTLAMERTCAKYALLISIAQS